MGWESWAGIADRELLWGDTKLCRGAETLTLGCLCSVSGAGAKMIQSMLGDRKHGCWLDVLTVWISLSQRLKIFQPFLLQILSQYLAEGVIFLKQKCDKWLPAAVASHTFGIQPGNVLFSYLPCLSSMSSPACVSARVSCPWLPTYHVMLLSLHFLLLCVPGVTLSLLLLRGSLLFILWDTAREVTFL